MSEGDPDDLPPEFGALALWVLDHLNVGVVVQSHDLQIVYVNPVARSILELDHRGDLLLSKLETWNIRDEHGRPYAPPLDRIVSEGLVFTDVLVQLQRPGAQLQWIRFDARPVELTDGGRGVLSVFADVTSPHAARISAEEREESFRLMTDNASDLMWRSDLQGRSVWVSQSVERMLGWRQDELTGADLSGLAHPDDRGRVGRTLDHSGQGGGRTIVARIRKYDGSYIPVMIRSAPFLDGGGQHVGTFVTARDMSTEFAERTALEESERRFRLVAELGEQLDGVHTVEKATHVCAEFLAKVIGDVCTVSVIRHDKVTATAMAGRAGPESPVGEEPLTIGGGTLVGRVAASGDTLLLSTDALDTYPDDVAAEFITYAGRHGCNAVLIAPLIADTSILGAVTLHRIQGESAYLPRDRELVEVVARRMALVIGDAQLREEVAQTQDALARSERQFRLALANAPIGMAIVSLEGRFLEVNQALCDILDYSQQDLRTLTFQEITVPEDLPGDLLLIEQLLSDEISNYTLEKRYVRRSGETVWAQLQVSLVRGDDGEPLYFISQVVDIEDRRRAAEDLRFRADHDPLTGLLNRVELTRRMSERMERERRDWAAVLYLDLDRFKSVNDSFGHAGGDAVIQATAHLLEAQLPGAHAIARMGGDEFVTFLDDLPDEPTAARIAQRVCNAVGAHEFEGRIPMTASIGVAIIPPGSDHAEWLRHADIAMYEAKRRGRNQVVVYEDGMVGLAHHR